jgi:cell wall-associated NlpC family hydrolase
MQNKFLPAAFDNDPRITPTRGDVAADWLDGYLKAERFVKPIPHTIGCDFVSLYKEPDDNKPIQTQLLYGESFDVLDEKNGWLWGQNLTDGYVGYIKNDRVTKGKHHPTHQVVNIGSWGFERKDLKSKPLQYYSFGALVEVVDMEERFAELSDGSFVMVSHLRAIDAPDTEPVSHAFRFLGVPYLWGGRSAVGLDCSSLIQLCMAQCNIAIPRDADLQYRSIGKEIAANLGEAQLMPGDLVFWPGHVAMLIDRSNIIHANTRSMAVSIDELAEFARWKGENEGQSIKAIKRLEY